MTERPSPPNEPGAALPWQQMLSLELIKAAPKLLIALLILIFLLALRGPIGALIERSTKVGIGPVSIEAAKASLGEAKPSGAKHDPYFTKEQIDRLARLYAEAVEETPSARVLWVDDNPNNNRPLVDFLDLMGVEVTVARSTQEGLQRLEERSFQAVVSDYSRPGDASQLREGVDTDWGAGAQFALALQKGGCGRRVLLFSSQSTDDKAIPPGVRSATNDYYQLLVDLAAAVRAAPPPCGTLQAPTFAADAAYLEEADQEAPRQTIDAPNAM